MPGLFIEAPTGVQPDAKQGMMQEITAAIRTAFGIHDVRIWLREYPPGNVAVDGQINAEPVKPVCFLEAPELASLEAKSAMVAKILAAVDKAYRDIANTSETMILMNHYPLANAGWAGRLGSENPNAVARIKRLNW